MKWNRVFGETGTLRTPTPKVPVNNVAFVVDESGSMAGLQAAVMGSFTEIFNTIRTEAKAQDTLVSMFKVDTVSKPVFLDQRPEFAELRDYRPNGMTPLNDGIGDAITHLETTARSQSGDVSFLVVVLTDGQENASRRFMTDQVRRMIQERQAKGNWTFVFQVPPGTSRTFLRNYGIEEGNTREWEPTTSGVRASTVATTSGTQHYFQARAQGLGKVSTFYSDLSSIDPKTVRANLNDLSGRYKSALVPRETEIRPFVEATTGRPYSVGSTFYQLTKPEYVQGNKGILLQEKGKKALWGGAEARSLIGLPAYGDVRVNPGNHGNYDLFVQSTSTNRKLVRGTRVFIEQ